MCRFICCCVQARERVRHVPSGRLKGTGKRTAKPMRRAAATNARRRATLRRTLKVTRCRELALEMPHRQGVTRPAASSAVAASNNKVMWTHWTFLWFLDAFILKDKALGQQGQEVKTRTKAGFLFTRLNGQPQFCEQAGIVWWRS